MIFQFRTSYTQNSFQRLCLLFNVWIIIGSYTEQPSLFSIRQFVTGLCGGVSWHSGIGLLFFFDDDNIQKKYFVVFFHFNCVLYFWKDIVQVSLENVNFLAILQICLWRSLSPVRQNCQLSLVIVALNPLLPLFDFCI